MNVDVVLLPRDLPPDDASDLTVIVLDVLRATTTIAAALTSGVREILIFESIAAAREGAAQRSGVLLCGEEQCLAPAGFDLGNSPGKFDRARHAGQAVCMSTTNGTHAILAARGAGRILCGALVNASAVARVARAAGADVLLLCSGTNGKVAAEDVIGAGALLRALRECGTVQAQSDIAWMAEQLFLASRDDLSAALGNTRGGRNVIAAGLEEDVAFAARIDTLDVVGEVCGEGPPIIRAVLAGT